MKKQLFKPSVWTLLAVFFAFIFVIVIVAGQIAAMYSIWVDSFFNARRFILVGSESDDDGDAQYFLSDFAKKDENGDLILRTDDDGLKHQIIDEEAMRAHSMDVAERVDEEGSVLLWNKNDALPLTSGDKVSAFGLGTLAWQYHGTGSGLVTIDAKVELKASLESRGLHVNGSLLSTLKIAGVGLGISNERVNEISWEKLNSTVRGNVESSVTEYGDAALYTIQRLTGEGRDTSSHNEFSDDNNYLSFTRAELSVIAGLQQLKRDGKLKKIILLLNSANPLNLKYLGDYDVDACLWAGFGGGAALDAVADILVGNANPSGHATDTWVYDLMSAPASANFGNFTFTEASGLPSSGSEYGGVHDKYVVYQEGIYVGYRYYETRYEDLVLGGRNAQSDAGVKAGEGNWKYANEVAYPFGHGESYTEFEYSGYSVQKKDDAYEVSMTIKNTGSLPGKDVMQVYLQKPYTEYDKQNKVEKAAVELVGFVKTDLLAAGESQPLTVTVPEYEFKSYDAYGKGTYILEKGDYFLAAGADAHNALNNILAAKGKTTEHGMDAEGDASFAHKITYSRDDFDKYSLSPSGYKVENRFDDADVNVYEGTDDQTITYLSRNDWGATYPRGSARLSCTSQKMITDMQIERKIESDPDAKMPVYNTVTSEYGKLTLIQLMGVPFDDPLWDDLLNQMSFEEQTNFVKSCSSGSTEVNAPDAAISDGPCGTRHGGNNMAFPSNTIVASTFNKELVEELGKAFGLEMLNREQSGLFGLAANIHRSARGGRAWEYYSEDGFLTGVMCSIESKALTDCGIILFTKHLALNDQETHRDGVTTWANEQSIREIYLKAFETGIVDGNINGIMTSFNRIGCTWAGLHKELLTDVLRNEWGFRGVTLTDTPIKDYMGAADNSVYGAAVIAGQDIWLGSVNDNLAEFKNNADFCNALRSVAHRYLYTRLNSNAMNGMTSNTRVLEVMPAWEITLLAIEITAGVLAAACLGMAIVSWILRYRLKTLKSENKIN